MDNVIRFGVSFEPKLLERFDKIIEKKGYRNRSEAIRDIAREYVVQEKKENIVGSVGQQSENVLCLKSKK